MIEKLIWDSEFFGYPVGRINLTEKTTGRMIRSLPGFNDYHLVYAFSDKELSPEFGDCLVARRVHFHKRLSEIKNGVDVTSFNPDLDRYEDLIGLVYQSGVLSRFRVDPNFRNDEYKRLYKRWVDKSIEDPDSRLLVARSENQPAGFVTFEFLDPEVTRLGIIAVDRNARKKGLGSLLVQMAENESIYAGRQHLYVTTHRENVPTIMLLQKNGYQEISSSFVYHFWKK